MDKNLGGQTEVQIELRATLGGLFHTLADFRKAEAIHRDNLPRMKSLLGDEHQRVADLMRDFACVLEHRGKHKESEALAREALALARKLHGDEHSDVAHSLDLIANALGGQKKYDEAVSSGRQSLAMYRRLRRDGSFALHHLAGWLDKLGRPDEAEPLYREALAIRRKEHSETHPEVVVLTKDLAEFHVRHGKLDEAEAGLRDLLSVQRKMLGNENREVAKTLAFLAATLIDNGRPAAGEPLARESLALHRKLFDDRSVEVAGALNDLGVAWYRLGRLDEAESVQSQSLALGLSLLPPDSSSLVKSYENLALTLTAHGKFAALEVITGERLAAFRQSKTTAPDKLEEFLSDHVEAVFRQRKYAEADPLYRELIHRRANRLPATNEEVVGPKASLGRLLADWAWADRSNSVPAEVRRLTSRSGRDANSGPDQSIVTSAATGPVDRAREAEHLLRECLAFREGQTNSSRGRLGDTRSRLGGAVLAVAVTDGSLTPQGHLAKVADAESLLVRGQELMEQSTSVARKYKRDGMERLVRLYEAWNKPDQAADWQAKLEAFNQTNAVSEPAP
ncbi:MAG TPA: tetratricopeptide repeat protein [Methylomirabilota bacterium]|nr:tetratricopeptide repeat protein [Methylomirabilota bacterium]